MDISLAYKFCPYCGKMLNMVTPFQFSCLDNLHEIFINPKPAGEALIINNQNEILLTKRKRNPHEGMWDVPGGFIEPGENLEEGIRREVREELRLEIQISRFVGGFSDIYEYKGYIQPVLREFYLATIAEGIIEANNEIAEFAFFPLSEIRKTAFAFSSTRKAIGQVI